MNNFAFFGTPTVASETLAILLASGFIPKVVVTNPDAPAGRGLTLTQSPVKQLALAHGIPVLTPRSLDAAPMSEIEGFGCTYAVVVAYGKIFPQSLIDAFPQGAINVHYSLLPKYRGASPVETALLHGDTITGVTVQQMTLDMDAGAILAQQETPIDSTETARELRTRLVTIGAQMLVDLLPRFERGGVTPHTQDHALATRSKKIKKEDGRLDLDQDAEGNWNKYRAYAVWPGTYFLKDGKRMKITKASFKNGTFVIERVIPEGKKEVEYVYTR